MALIDQVKAVCDRLALCGWRELLLKVTTGGLDLNAADLGVELSKELTVDRTIAGFEDFASDGKQGITPGSPARSLLYHAFASPNVVDASLTDYPTREELESVENYVFGVAPPSLEELKARAGVASLALVVFSCEYRPAADTPHHRHADLCFSRTGIARIGTVPPRYESSARGFLSYIDTDEFAIPVQPARYAVYIAYLRPGGEGLLGDYLITGDEQKQFWTPLHKLFPGSECLRDVNALELAFSAHHINEKLRRIHLVLETRPQSNSNGANSWPVRHYQTGWQQPFLDEPPFRFEEGIARAESLYGGCLIVPVAHETLTTPALFHDRPLSFRVPPDYDLVESSSLDIEEDGIASNDGELHSAPAYVYARDQVWPTAADLNREPNVAARIAAGGYDARHYLDFTGDGWIDARCEPPVAGESRAVAAYSIVTSPDFMPGVTQRELQDWTRSVAPKGLQKAIWAQPPTTLADQRFAPNIELKEAHFRPDDTTITAVICMPSPAEQAEAAPVKRQPSPLRRSFLPDAAAGVFAPGWDIGLTKTGDVEHLAQYGQSSPFLEDAKLCAALSAFWPAAAPDTARVYSPSHGYPTITPLTDQEIGLLGEPAWDGISAPQTDFSRGVVSYLSLDNSDYVRTALDRRFTVRLTHLIDTKEYAARTWAMLRVYRALGVGVDEPIQNDEDQERLIQGKSRWAVLSFRQPLPRDHKELAQAEAATGHKMAESLYRFMVYLPVSASAPDRPGNPQIKIRVDPNDPTRRLVEIERLVTLYVDSTTILLRKDDGPWEIKSG